MTGLPEDCRRALRPILARYVAGDVSGEIALMQCLLALGDQAIPTLDRLAETSPPCRELAHLAAANRDGLSQVATLLAGGLADLLPAGDGALSALRTRFDAAVALAPEASVALYSLGSAAILDRAGAEIGARLREWSLLGQDRTVLDIGCGIGRIERLLAPEVGAIIGIDLSPAMIAEARRRCHGLANVSFAVCDGGGLVRSAGGGGDLPSPARKPAPSHLSALPLDGGAPGRPPARAGVPGVGGGDGAGGNAFGHSAANSPPPRPSSIEGEGVGAANAIALPRKQRSRGRRLSVALDSRLRGNDGSIFSDKGLSEFAVQSFDLVLAIDVFPYIVAADPALAERHFADAARLLRAGGALAILNFSYRGDLGADRRDVARLAARHGFAVRRAGTRDLRLWDGATFLLTR